MENIWYIFLNAQKEEHMNTIRTIAPGAGLAVLIAAAARGIESLLPVHLIGAPVAALFIGIACHQFIKDAYYFAPGLTFCSKRVLKFAIILLGGSLSAGVLLHVGKLSLVVMIFTLFTCFGGGALIGRALGLNWKLSNLISAGTGICGGSAIAALAPAIDAKEEDISYALSATFIFDMIMVVLFPLLGTRLGLSDMAYGLWAGTAVNDTSSVVAAGYAFSEAAGDFAAMVKLTRTLSIIPVVLIFSAIHASSAQKTESVSIKGLLPVFILLFVVMAVMNSIGVISPGVAGHLKSVSSFLMVVSLAAIGLSTDVRKMVSAGAAPMIHGFLISSLVVIVAITVQVFMGLV
jgi:uncharacterized integral membrane protein (TIGR00698 family)